jgi:hypothetical protein
VLGLGEVAPAQLMLSRRVGNLDGEHAAALHRLSGQAWTK